MFINIKIEKLFGIYDYDIPMKNDENIKIITGPNGYGKTMILNIIYNLFNKNFYFFRKLNFLSIEFKLDNDRYIIIKKEKPNKISDVNFILNIKDTSFNSFSFRGLNEDFISRLIPATFKTEKGTWYSNAEKKEYEEEELISKNKEIFDVYYNSNGFEGDNASILIFENWLQENKISIIKEQRIFQKTDNNELQNNINTKAKEMAVEINHYKEKYSVLESLLRSNFTKRLVNEKDKINSEEFRNRYSEIKKIEKQLSDYHIIETYNEEAISFNDSDAKALLVYLKDSESMLNIYYDLLRKLNLFTQFLNEKSLTSKNIKINNKEGFYFETLNGDKLQNTDLSSGEQHLVILLFDLIFQAKQENFIQKSIVLIDEPELSLHIAWQKEFLNDLISINQLHNSNTQFIIATHAPAIINGRWDLVYDLFAKDNEI